MGAVLSEIIQLTTTIETNYPELYRFLDEDPMTLPQTGTTGLDLETMQNYLQSLKVLLNTYLNTQNT